MNEQVAIQNLLRERLTEIQRSNPNYSLRAYARKLSVHVGALTYIINGKRNVSKVLAERITQKLLLDPQQRSEILSLFPDKVKYRKATNSPPGLEPRYLELSAAQFKIAAEWEHFAIMSLANCERFEGKPEWIADRLAITPTKARQALKRLIQVGLLDQDAQGRITRTQKSYRTADDIADVSLKKHHEQSLELAKESLFRDDVKTRDFTTITMAIDPKKVDQAKDRIRQFEDEMSDLLESGQRAEVYRLAVQFFPLSRIESEIGANK
jgi:uncharacterized protein (TIGR02147 family)